MAEEIDRKIMPETLQTVFSLSLGAAYKSFEMMKSPSNSISTMLSEMKELFSMPKDAGEGLKGKAEAVAGVWMSKGMDLMETCKNAGEKFTEAK
jgi:hypothetical protein